MKGFCQEAIDKVAVQQLQTKASSQDANNKVDIQQLRTKASVKKPSTRLLPSSFTQLKAFDFCQEAFDEVTAQQLHANKLPRSPAASNKGFCQEAIDEVAVQ